jgi:threonine dehydrogenase-like Zn-dependent dehydrogenase
MVHFLDCKVSCPSHALYIFLQHRPLIHSTAEYARIPFADNSLIPVPITHSTNEPILLDYLFISDVFSTAWSGVTFSGFKPGDSVVVFGAGSVGLLAAYSAILRGASIVYSIDHVQDRLHLAASICAIPINFHDSDPVSQTLAREPNGVRRSVEAVNFEAGTASEEIDSGITLRHMVNMTARGGGIGVVGLFNNTLSDFHYGEVYEKSIAVNGGIVLPLQVADELVPLIVSG